MLVEIEKKKRGRALLEYIPNENPEIVNLEHILPKVFSKAKWPSFTEEEHYKYAVILGNLTIMRNEDNKIAGQDSFLNKQKIYKTSQIKLTNELANYTNWTSAEIEKRQDELGDLAIKRWSI